MSRIALQEVFSYRLHADQMDKNHAKKFSPIFHCDKGLSRDKRYFSDTFVLHFKELY